MSDPTVVFGSQVLLDLTFVPAGQPIGVDVRLEATTDRRFRLTWGDRVANDWTEVYDDLAVCFARLAVLLRVAATGGFFRHRAEDPDVWNSDEGGDGPSGFVADATRFLDDQLGRPS